MTFQLPTTLFSRGLIQRGTHVCLSDSPFVQMSQTFTARRTFFFFFWEGECSGVNYFFNFLEKVGGL